MRVTGKPDGWQKRGKFWFLYKNEAIIGIIRPRIADEKYSVIVNTSTMQTIAICDDVREAKKAAEKANDLAPI